MKPDYIIFSDASLKRHGTKKYYAGFGTVVLNTSTLNYATFSGPLADPSVLFGEAWAIFRGLEFLMNLNKGKDKKLKVLVVSDSKLNIQSLTDWSRYSWDLSDYKNWKKRDGSPVAMQDIYRKIFKVMVDGNLKVKFVHINGHMDVRSYLKDSVIKRLEKVGVSVSKKTLDAFIEMNCIADKAATDASEQLRQEEGQFIRMIRKEKK